MIIPALARCFSARAPPPSPLSFARLRVRLRRGVSAYPDGSPGQRRSRAPVCVVSHYPLTVGGARPPARARRGLAPALALAAHAKRSQPSRGAPTPRPDEHLARGGACQVPPRWGQSGAEGCCSERVLGPRAGCWPTTLAGGKGTSGGTRAQGGSVASRALLTGTRRHDGAAIRYVFCPLAGRRRRRCRLVHMADGRLRGQPQPRYYPSPAPSAQVRINRARRARRPRIRIHALTPHGRAQQQQAKAPLALVGCVTLQDPRAGGVHFRASGHAVCGRIRLLARRGRWLGDNIPTSSIRWGARRGRRTTE
ncbi:hypothetical protein BC628DRAFT_343970 [Trametes gibbosa]|nr:hypothetical protein BC628DRAFT_343970 [Trametes gibbosa]